MSEGNSVVRGGRYRVAAKAGTAVTRDRAPASLELQRLPQGVIVVCAETWASGAGGLRARISSPGGWVSADDLAPEPAAEAPKLNYETFLERHLEIRPGDHYGLAFPFTLAGLREAGADFLTAAFRAAGTIAITNRVTEIVSLDDLGIPGASENALLTVAYAEATPGLQTKLFVKVPPADPPHKYALLKLHDGEIAMALLSRERALPVTLPTCYFADHCSHTRNFILITERIAFGVAPIEPAYRKGFDQHVPEAEEHYLVLTKALARLVSAHKTGSLGHDIETIFPFARAARDFDPIEAPEPPIDRLIDFIGRVAPQLFLPETTTPAFLAQWREDVLFGLRHKDTLLAYLLRDIDYTGLCHPNLNVDNAWYWRDADGALQVGLLDWGGAGQMSIAQALSGMLMMPDPDRHLGLVRRVIDMFIADYAAGSGILLDRDELHLQYKASLYSTALCMFITILADSLRHFPEDFFDGMEDRFDSRLQETGFCSAVIWIDNLLREWLDGVTPGEACRRIVAQAEKAERAAAP